MNKFKPILLFLATMITGGLILFSYLTFYREYEFRNCVAQLAKELNINPDYSELVKHISDSIYPGMGKEEVHSALRETAEITVTKIDSATGILERITIKICRHPLNNFDLYAYYTFGNKLKEVRIENSP
ncbi:MAG: hypothetical protein K8S20_16705 [Chloroflexi bacterium]|nr:hypothetical protein [Chloroflexota bacterium]